MHGSESVGGLSSLRGSASSWHRLSIPSASFRALHPAKRINALPAATTSPATPAAPARNAVRRLSAVRCSHDSLAVSVAPRTTGAINMTWLTRFRGVLGCFFAASIVLAAVAGHAATPTTDTASPATQAATTASEPTTRAGGSSPQTSWLPIFRRSHPSGTDTRPDTRPSNSGRLTAERWIVILLQQKYLAEEGAAHRGKRFGDLAGELAASRSDKPPPLTEIRDT